MHVKNTFCLYILNNVKKNQCNVEFTAELL